MDHASPLMIIALDASRTSELTELAQRMGYSGAPVTSGDGSAAARILEGRVKPPEFLLIDIAAKGSAAFADLEQIAQHCEASVSVVVLGDTNDVALYREMKQRGVLDYFPRPFQAADISAAFTGVRRAQRGQGSGHVIACMSAASGDGSSTVAVNTAYCIAQEFKQPTVLVDMDYQFGLIAKSLDLSAPFGTRELFEDTGRGLDDLLVQKMLVNYGENLSIIAAPNELRLMPSIRAEVIEEMLEVLRARYKYVIIDLPHVWTDWTAAALAGSDQICLTAQLWLRSLTHSTRLLTAWQSAGIERSKVRLIINRSGAKFKEGITAEEFERICNHKIDAHVNNDIKAIVAAENQGKTLYQSAQGTLIQQQLRQISQDIITHFEGGAGATSSSGGKKGLMGMFEKKASA